MRIETLVLSVLFGSAAVANAAPGDPVRPACDKGMAWHLPLPQGTWTDMEAAVKVEGAAQLVAVCNCTPDAAGKNTGVWIDSSAAKETLARMGMKAASRGRAQSNASGTTPYYLPGQSCAVVGSATIVLRHGDALDQWGSVEVLK